MTAWFGPVGRREPLALVVAVGLALLGGCQSPERADTPPVVRASAIALPEGDARNLGELRLEAGFVLSSADPRFGGLSGLWLRPDGTELISVSDRGTLWQATLEHDRHGRLAGLSEWHPIEPGRAPADPDGRAGRDAEALAGNAGGGLAIAYEGAHRLRRIMRADPGAAAIPLPAPAALDRPHNRGIEALASLPDGRLLALSEGIPAAGGDAGDLQGWLIGDRDVWSLSYRARDGFVPTGAARLDGVLYVVERRFSLLGGFGARVVSLSVDQIKPGARLEPRPVGTLTTLDINENFEGIAVRSRADGQPLIYVVADDNFSALQQTFLLQLRHELDLAADGAPP